MDEYNLGKKDFQSNYFHFTKQDNLESIIKNGLVPKMGHHAQSLEKTKKVFL